MLYIKKKKKESKFMLINLFSLWVFLLWQITKTDLDAEKWGADVTNN
jgi:hypothetical protein